ncbi:hypothetical protein TSTA_011900 [Talaromyces stipitatus ATCC 10500]|uniref:Uncharacterized protein n=1 Tax=Talaromyces stipitatus (strain ATCC 10500 / CBS 375.48 / QM 6759 / NRRL 1006) TaxID=441959 RepID=B8ME04_TALSN|nr:uncharacterized protein TSTA_011900 [Talaromyces stipitatus ATCC 10500]EED16081.1 hypothetical protein TSTA_011900 [Talaromyces stipitatus ATCC 10500]
MATRYQSGTNDNHPLRWSINFLTHKMLGTIAQGGLNFRYQNKYVEAGKQGLVGGQVGNTQIVYI